MLPIQAAPIDRANRAIRFSSQTRGIAPRMFPGFPDFPGLPGFPFPPACETLCNALPPPLRTACMMACGSAPIPIPGPIPTPFPWI
jgi:hypothetical protein